MGLLKKRVTASLDNDIIKSLKDLQVQIFLKTGNSISLSEIINECLKKSMNTDQNMEERLGLAYGERIS